MIEQSSSLQQSGVFSLSYKKHQKLVRHNDSSSKVNIDLYLFQPSFHPGRPVWCLESAAALPILVHSVIKNRLKVTVKYQPLTPQKWWQSYTWRPNTFNGMAIFCTQQKTVSCCWFVDDAVKILRGCQDQDLRHETSSPSLLHTPPSGSHETVCVLLAPAACPNKACLPRTGPRPSEETRWRRHRQGEGREVRRLRQLRHRHSDTRRGSSTGTDIARVFNLLLKDEVMQTRQL